MMTTGADVYQLQSLDSTGDQKRRRLAEIEAALGESEALKAARRAVAELQKQVKTWRVRQQDLDLETQGGADKISREEKRLYGGVVKNPKELEELQAEVASLKRRQQGLEEKLLEAMIEREEAESQLVQAQAHLDTMQAEWSEQQEDLLVEQKDLQAQLAQVKQARDALLPRIDADDLATYQSLRRRKAGVAVVPLESGSCGGCGMAVPAGSEWQLREGKLVTCSNCERILVRL